MKWRDIEGSRGFAEFKRHWVMCAGVVAFFVADKVTGSPPLKAREIVLLILAILSGIRSLMDEANYN